ncbi:MAG: peptidylprolyl isomerase [Thermoleophilia bacterium]|jgi:FKBP-type peptidyl-prolyl cis-trans isomerase 2
MEQAKHGDTVKVHYTGKLTDGTEFDSSVGRDPLEFTIGSGQVIPGFESAVVGMSPGESSNTSIPVDQAYGPRSDEMLVEVPRENLAEGIQPEVGQKLQAMSEDGHKIALMITAVSDASVTLDGNHPLAGKELFFDLELIDIV